MSQRDDENEIETRLRAAFMARSEQVTHQSLRPGVVPGTRAALEAETARANAAVQGRKRFSWNLSWRGLLVPAMVTAALVIGVGVGVALPDGGSSSTVGAAGSGGGSQLPATTVPASSAPAGAAPTEQAFGGLRFQTEGWKLTEVSDTTACLLPPGHAAADANAKLPCGVDSLMIKSDATATGWPANATKDKGGWWPAKYAALGDIPCPVASKSAAAGGGATATASTVQQNVKTSVVFRTDGDYALGGTTKAAYQEWSATCTDGTGFRPMLWQLKDGKTVVTAISVSAAGDRQLLAIVASMRSS